jgi:endonuclease III
VIERLAARYGKPETPPTSDPFELVLWENVAYLAPPARRREAFELLVESVGTEPRTLLAAKPSALERVTARGILKQTFAAKLRGCAKIAIDEFGGDLRRALPKPLDGAVRALRSFPGIGEPGAEKILLFSGRQALLAPESNGLRVLVRLGLIEEQSSYARTYAESRALNAGLGKVAFIQQAHLLLQKHGQTLCKRGAPLCSECPLATACAYARKNRPRARGKRGGGDERVRD